MRRLLALGLFALTAWSDPEELRLRVREVQQEEGYEVALQLLEGKLDHPSLVVTYGDLCVWSGQEERGLRHLAESGLAPAERLRTELWLLSCLGRYREAEERARAAGWGEWVEWARREAGLRERIAGRTRRAFAVAATTFALLALGVALLFRLAPRAPARA